MRTTVDLPEDLLRSVQELTGAKTRKDALIIALEDYRRRRRLERLLEAAGTLEFELDARAIREQDARRRPR